MKVFLGGTCTSIWRDYFIPMVTCDHFNPVVDDWNDEARRRELLERKVCDYCLYVITPGMKGYYSIAEVIDDSNKRPEKTILCVLREEISYGQVDPARSFSEYPGEVKKTTFDEQEMYSWTEVGHMVKRNGCQYFTKLSDVANFLNSQK